MLGSILLVTWNFERLLARWTSAAEFSVYFRDEATSDQRGAIEGLIDDSRVADGREYVSKTGALARFRREFAEFASLATGFDDNSFPAAIEVRIRADAENDDRADALVRRVATLAGVADVRYEREWLTRIASGLAVVRGTGFALALLMALAAAVTVASVVRLGLQARRRNRDHAARRGAARFHPWPVRRGGGARRRGWGVDGARGPLAGVRGGWRMAGGRSGVAAGR